MAFLFLIGNHSATAGFISRCLKPFAKTKPDPFLAAQIESRTNMLQLSDSFDPIVAASIQLQDQALQRQVRYEVEHWLQKGAPFSFEKYSQVARRAGTANQDQYFEWALFRVLQIDYPNLQDTHLSHFTFLQSRSTKEQFLIIQKVLAFLKQILPTAEVKNFSRIKQIATTSTTSYETVIRNLELWSELFETSQDELIAYFWYKNCISATPEELADFPQLNQTNLKTNWTNFYSRRNLNITLTPLLNLDPLVAIIENTRNQFLGDLAQIKTSQQEHEFELSEPEQAFAQLRALQKSALLPFLAYNALIDFGITHQDAELFLRYFPILPTETRLLFLLSVFNRLSERNWSKMEEDLVNTGVSRREANALVVLWEKANLEPNNSSISLKTFTDGIQEYFLSSRACEDFRFNYSMIHPSKNPSKVYYWPKITEPTTSSKIRFELFPLSRLSELQAMALERRPDLQGSLLDLKKQKTEAASLLEEINLKRTTGLSEAEQAKIKASAYLQPYLKNLFQTRIIEVAALRLNEKNGNLAPDVKELSEFLTAFDEKKLDQFLEELLDFLSNGILAPPLYSEFRERMQVIPIGLKISPEDYLKETFVWATAAEHFREDLKQLVLYQLKYRSPTLETNSKERMILLMQRLKKERNVIRKGEAIYKKFTRTHKPTPYVLARFFDYASPLLFKNEIHSFLSIFNNQANPDLSKKRLNKIRASFIGKIISTKDDALRPSIEDAISIGTIFDYPRAPSEIENSTELEIEFFKHFLNFSEEGFYASPRSTYKNIHYVEYYIANQLGLKVNLSRRYNHKTGGVRISYIRFEFFGSALKNYEGNRTLINYIEGNRTLMNYIVGKSLRGFLSGQATLLSGDWGRLPNDLLLFLQPVLETDWTK